eukprot:3620548-Rhodomonas_salina.1
MARASFCQTQCWQHGSTPSFPSVRRCRRRNQGARWLETQRKKRGGPSTGPAARCCGVHGQGCPRPKPEVRWKTRQRLLPVSKSGPAFLQREARCAQQLLCTSPGRTSALRDPTVPADHGA